LAHEINDTDRWIKSRLLSRNFCGADLGLHTDKIKFHNGQYTTGQRNGVSSTAWRFLQSNLQLGLLSVLRGTVWITHSPSGGGDSSTSTS
jgi:hypothetical protein